MTTGTQRKRLSLASSSATGAFTTAAFLFGVGLAAASSENPVADAVAAIVRDYNHILVDFNPSEKSTLRFEPGSFVHRMQFDPTESTFSVSQFGFLCTPEYSTARVGAHPVRPSST